MTTKSQRPSPRKARLGSKSTRGVKAERGRTDSSQTPLSIRTQGVAVSAVLAAAVSRTLGTRLGPFARHIDSITVRFEDINGPRGGVDNECRIHVMMPSRPAVIVSKRAATARVAFDAASHGVRRAVKRDLERMGFADGAAKGPSVADERGPASIPNAPPDNGSLIGRRVGSTAADLARAAERPEKARRDARVDTAQPGLSASDRRAGGGSTASRNTKLRTPRSVAALEDSAQPQPSRKSTRKSSNRTQGAQKLAQRARAVASSPQTNAAAASVRRS